MGTCLIITSWYHSTELVFLLIFFSSFSFIVFISSSIANSSVKNLIREDKIPQITSIMEINKKLGMVTMKAAIMDLLDRGVISEEVARDNLIGLDV